MALQDELFNLDIKVCDILYSLNSMDTFNGCSEEFKLALSNKLVDIRSLAFDELGRLKEPKTIS